MGTYQDKMQPYNAGADADINQGDPKAGPTAALARRWGGGEQHLEGEDHVEERGHVGEDHVEGHGHVGEDHVGEDHVQLFNQT